MHTTFEADTCILCKEPLDYKRYDIVRLVNCDHILHRRCAKNSMMWTLQACPVCRIPTPVSQGGVIVSQDFSPAIIMLAGALVNAGIMDSYQEALSRLTRANFRNLSDIYHALMNSTAQAHEYRWEVFAKPLQLKKLNLAKLRHSISEMFKDNLINSFYITHWRKGEHEKEVQDLLRDVFSTFAPNPENFLYQWQQANQASIHAISSQEPFNYTQFFELLTRRDLHGLDAWIQNVMQHPELRSYRDMAVELLARSARVEDLPIQEYGYPLPSIIVASSTPVPESPPPEPLHRINDNELYRFIISVLLAILIFVLVVIISIEETSGIFEWSIKPLCDHLNFIGKIQSSWPVSIDLIIYKLYYVLIFIITMLVGIIPLLIISTLEIGVTALILYLLDRITKRLGILV